MILIPDIEKTDYLIINGTPFCYWAYLSYNSPTILNFILLGISIVHLIILFYYREEITFRLKSGLNTREFIKMFKDSPILFVDAFVGIIFAVISWILMLIYEKDKTIWSMIILWFIAFIVDIAFMLNKRIKSKRKEMEYFLTHTTESPKSK